MQENSLCALSLRLDIGDAHTYGIGPYVFYLKKVFRLALLSDTKYRFAAIFLWEA